MARRSAMIGRVPAKEMRRIRNRVRQTASLISGHKAVYERPGDHWACDFVNRVIVWRPTDPFEPRHVMDDDEVLMNTVHEAAHLEITGGHTTPSDFTLSLFHVFINSVEDVRIERWLEKKFPGFSKLRQTSNQMYMAHQQKNPYIMVRNPLPFQVGMNWMVLEEVRDEHAPLNLLGHQYAKDFAVETWPQVTRICNAASTQQMSTMMEPYFRELMLSKEEKRAPDPSNIPEGNDAEGNDELPDRLERSPLPKNPLRERLEVLFDKAKADGEDIVMVPGELAHPLMVAIVAGEAEGDAKQAAMEFLDKEAQAQPTLQQSNEMLVGQQAGTGGHPKAPPGTENMWTKAAPTVISETKAFARKMESTLRSNAMDDWESGHERGQLDMGVAYKSMAGDMRVFRELHSPEGLDYTFGLIVDMSSSQYSRVHDILRCSIIMLEAFERVGLPNFCLPWSGHPGVMKPVDKPLSGFKPYLGGALGKAAGGTYEAPALIMAEEEFSKTRSQEKVLYTITDGDTTGRYESVELIQELMDKGIKPIAIGIRCNPSHYPRVIRIESASELKSLLPKLTAEFVKKGR